MGKVFCQMISLPSFWKEAPGKTLEKEVPRTCENEAGSKRGAPGREVGGFGAFWAEGGAGEGAEGIGAEGSEGNGKEGGIGEGGETNKTDFTWAAGRAFWGAVH